MVVEVTGTESLNLARALARRERTVPNRDTERCCRVCVGELAPQDQEDDVLFSLSERRYRFHALASASCAPRRSIASSSELMPFAGTGMRSSADR